MPFRVGGLGKVCSICKKHPRVVGRLWYVQSPKKNSEVLSKKNSPVCTKCRKVIRKKYGRYFI